MELKFNNSIFQLASFQLDELNVVKYCFKAERSELDTVRVFRLVKSELNAETKPSDRFNA